VEPGRAEQFELTGGSVMDGKLTALPESEEVKTTPVTEVGEEEQEDRPPEASLLPAVETLVTDLPGG